ncbi:MAG TPA: GNAT family N-acetyltransferase [Terriglobales bacterium]|nr:GNAT family N-acetyltransferase [Terriglobales bacterium]
MRLMLTIRPAEKADVAVILQFIRDLAEYEREPHAATATEVDLLRDGWGAEPKFRCLIAEWNGAPVGFALYFFNYSTWQGRPGLYAEDVYVRPEYRGRGIGKAIFIELARVALRKNCGRFQWQVLDWNQPAIDFYKSLGGRFLNEWLTVRLEGEQIETLAASGRGTAPSPHEA